MITKKELLRMIDGVADDAIVACTPLSDDGGFVTFDRVDGSGWYYAKNAPAGMGKVTSGKVFADAVPCVMLYPEHKELAMRGDVKQVLGEAYQALGNMIGAYYSNNEDPFDDAYDGEEEALSARAAIDSATGCQTRISEILKAAPGC